MVAFGEPFGFLSVTMIFFSVVFLNFFINFAFWIFNKQFDYHCIMKEYVLIVISTIFVNNIVLTHFLGICPFFGVSKKISTAMGMGFAVTFVMTISSVCTYLCYKFILRPLEIEFLQLITYILIIASLVQMVEIVIKKASPVLYQALGVYLPLMSVNCIILGTAILINQQEYNLIRSVVFAVTTGLGFALAMVVFAGIREQLEQVVIPKGMRGVPIALVTAGLLALAFMGFAGIV